MHVSLYNRSKRSRGFRFGNAKYCWLLRESFLHNFAPQIMLICVKEAVVAHFKIIISTENIYE